MSAVLISYGVRCGIDGSLLRLILQTSTFSLYTCVAAGHTTRTGAAPPLEKPTTAQLGRAKPRRDARPSVNKPVMCCELGACLEPKAPGHQFCAEHRASISAYEREKYQRRKRS